MSRRIGSLLFALCLGTTAHASGISKQYEVQPAQKCDLQENTIEKIDVTDTQVTMNLFNDQIPGQGPWDLTFEAPLGDHITRPTPEFIKDGYTSDDRTIASFDYATGDFKFSEYVYDMSESDEQGLANGFFTSIEMTGIGTEQITYAKKYSDGEVYRCTLVAVH